MRMYQKSEKKHETYGQVFLPPDPEATGCLEIIPVHSHMDSQVENNGNPRLIFPKTNRTLTKFSFDALNTRHDWYLQQSSYQQVECSTKLDMGQYCWLRSRKKKGGEKGIGWLPVIRSSMRRGL